MGMPIGLKIETAGSPATRRQLNGLGTVLMLRDNYGHMFIIVKKRFCSSQGSSGKNGGSSGDVASDVRPGRRAAARSRSGRLTRDPSVGKGAADPRAAADMAIPAHVVSLDCRGGSLPRRQVACGVTDAGAVQACPPDRCEQKTRALTCATGGELRPEAGECQGNTDRSDWGRSRRNRGTTGSNAVQ